ncbi:MAG: hypothetical protein B6I34_03665 [Anaerolineaceae bacterium 4572_32.1]|nr:MAG: hypothetical protein B6I34_03665 [Anaerolineaceae bacterium 4572_32.1]
MSYRELSLWSFLAKMASNRSTPAGGSAAAVTGAMAAALLAKMGRLALRRRSGEAFQEEGGGLSDLVVEAEALRRRLIALAHADAQVYRIASNLRQSEGASAQEIEAAWQETVSVPLQIAAGCERLLQLAKTLHLAGLAAADVQAVLVLARACIEVQLLNATLNLSRLKTPHFRLASEKKLKSLRQRLANDAFMDSVHSS